MTTTLFLHAASSTISGTLPSTEQSTTLTAGASPFDAQTVNRNMNITAGTSQNAITSTAVTTTNLEKIYITKFVSDPLDSSSTSISANTWTYAAAYSSVAGTSFFPAGQSGGGGVPGAMYVWRPSTGAYIGKIFDTSGGMGPTNYGKSTAIKGVVVTTAGSAVTAATGDVLILEAWGLTSSGTSQTYSYYVDGTNTTFGDNATVTSAGARISTPQALTFSAPPSSVSCTVTGKTIIPNKLVTIH